MNNVNVLKKRSVMIIISLFFFLIPTCFTKSLQSPVTDRELLMLAIMSYSNDQKEDVTQMQDDEFNSKWFAGYADPSELDGWKVVDSVINTDVKRMNGFSVVAYKKGKNVVIAFRGTDSGIIQENWGYFVLNREHPQAKHAINYINSLKNASFISYDTNIYITGHSLGGYLATFALGKILSIDSLKNKVVKTVTFNGLGIGYILDKAMLKRLSKVSEDKLVNYSVKGDAVSLIGKHFTKPIYADLVMPKLRNVPAKVLGNAHFPYSFFAKDTFSKNI